MHPSPPLAEVWPEVRRIAARTMPFVFATVNADGTPQVTPIGSVWLDRDAPRGHYFEKFPTRLRENLDRDGRFALLLTDMSLGLWTAALLRGRFDRLPAVRLLGRAGPRRPSTEAELARWHRRVRLAAGTRGHRLLWREMAHARDLHFDAWAPVSLGAVAPAPAAAARRAA